MEIQGYLYRAKGQSMGSYITEMRPTEAGTLSARIQCLPSDRFRSILKMLSSAVSVEKVPNSAPLEYPEINQVDHLIRGYEGATMVLETMRSRLQAAKEQKLELPHERLKRLEEELDWHQHENDFYGICYDIYQRLYSKVIEVSQHIILQSYFEPGSTPNGDPFLYDALSRLNTAVKESQVDEYQAEVAWKGYWSIPKTVDPSSSWI